MEPSERLKQLPPYLFAEIDRRKRELLKRGKDVIDLGVGDPDLPTPKFIIDALQEAAKDPRHHRYSLDSGLPSFREAIARWFEKRFRVKLDPEKEVLPLIGSKEGIAHLPLAVLNPGDAALVPDPGYPPYQSGTIFAGAGAHPLPLLEANGFLPDFASVGAEVLKKARLLYLNYPNNPTAAVAGESFFREAVDFAHRNHLLIAQDAAYSEISFDGYRAPSILQLEGAREVAVEFHSLSKTFNMTGWRVGFVVGNREVLSHLGRLKSNLDSGIFQAIQIAGERALAAGEKAVEESVRVYELRRDLFVRGLSRLGWAIAAPRATFYCWIRVPPGYTSAELALKFLEEMSVVVTPGNGFGANGEGYFRVALTVPEERLEEALARIQKSHRHLHVR